MNSGSDLARAALALARRGIAIFPLAPRTKVPMLNSHGCRDATRDSDKICAWWTNDPCLNVGIATGSLSGVWALDVDPRHGGDSSLRQLEAIHGPLPTTVESATPSGGRHLYFAWPQNGPEIRNSTSRVGRGIDVRGEGGSVVCPPSRLANGRCYRWVANGAHGFVTAPHWLIALALPPPRPPRPASKPLTGDVSRYVAAAAARELAELEHAVAGTRNARLNATAFNLAGFVLAGALPEDWTKAQLEARAVGIGLPMAEVRRTIASAFAAAIPRDLPR